MNEGVVQQTSGAQQLGGGGRPWKPSDPGRWAELGLSEPGAAHVPASVGDALIWALCPPGSRDPVEGIVAGVRAEMAALAGMVTSAEVAELLAPLCRRLDVAVQLLRWTDNRERLPMESDEVEEGAK